MKPVFRSLLVLFSAILTLNVFPVSAIAAGPASPQVDGGQLLYLPLVTGNYRAPINQVVFAAGYSNSSPRDSIYVMNPDGTGIRKLASSTAWTYYGPRWSPDRTRIVFFGENKDGYGIFIMNSDGSGLRQMKAATGFSYHPTWSVDGLKIVFSSDLFNPGATTPNDLYEMNTDGSGTAQKITDTPTVHEQNPEWSPDGKRLLYASSSQTDFDFYQIHIRDTAKGTDIDISNPSYSELYPRWSPGGEKIVFIRNLGSVTNPNRQVFVMNADGSSQIQLTNNSGQSFYPCWSPDGKKIMFQTYFNDYADIYVMNVDGTGVINITNTQTSFASITPDWQ